MRKTILFIGLGVAFLAVSLWVIFSGGKSAKAVRAKFRLGGAILTLISATNMVGCVSCYDPAIGDNPEPPQNIIDLKSEHEASDGVFVVRNGDKMLFNVECDTIDEAIFVITSLDGEVLQLLREKVVVETQMEIALNIDVGSYRGVAELHIYYQYEEGASDNKAYTYNPYLLNIVD
ncbi:MAG: hypothetical protein E7131_05280 [Rikenellaceae bacterium]|mgnify:CR=1 FL=1|nr:hypothetical protein [Rikenellaceae bacterium]